MKRVILVVWLVVLCAVVHALPIPDFAVDFENTDGLTAFEHFHGGNFSDSKDGYFDTGINSTYSFNVNPQGAFTTGLILQNMSYGYMNTSLTEPLSICFTFRPFYYDIVATNSFILNFGDSSNNIRVNRAADTLSASGRLRVTIQNDTGNENYQGNSGDLPPNITQQICVIKSYPEIYAYANTTILINDTITLGGGEIDFDNIKIGGGRTNAYGATGIIDNICVWKAELNYSDIVEFVNAPESCADPNQVPTITDLYITPMPTADTDDNLSAHITVSDTDQDQLQFNITWLTSSDNMTWSPFNGNAEYWANQAYADYGGVLYNSTTGSILATNTTPMPYWMVSALVTDGINTYSINSSAILVRNKIPIITANSSGTSVYSPVNRGQNLTFNITGTDPDNDTVRLKVCSNANATWGACTLLCSNDTGVHFYTSSVQQITCGYATAEVVRANYAYAIINDSENVTSAVIPFWVNQPPVAENLTHTTLETNIPYYWGDTLNFIGVDLYDPDNSTFPLSALANVTRPSGTLALSGSLLNYSGAFDLDEPGTWEIQVLVNDSNNAYSLFQWNVTVENTKLGHSGGVSPGTPAVASVCQVNLSTHNLIFKGPGVALLEIANTGTMPYNASLILEGDNVFIFQDYVELVEGAKVNLTLTAKGSALSAYNATLAFWDSSCSVERVFLSQESRVGTVKSYSSYVLHAFQAGVQYLLVPLFSTLPGKWSKFQFINRLMVFLSWVCFWGYLFADVIAEEERILYLLFVCGVVLVLAMICLIFTVGILGVVFHV